MKSIPTATSLPSARNLAARYTASSGYAHYIVMGECTEDRQTYYVATAREVRTLKAAGFEVLE